MPKWGRRGRALTLVLLVGILLLVVHVHDGSFAAHLGRDLGRRVVGRGALALALLVLGALASGAHAGRGLPLRGAHGDRVLACAQ